MSVIEQGSRPGRVARRRQRTREALLRAGYRLMSENGVAATTIQEITEDADVALGTFYNYFETKTELAARVLDCVIHELGRRNDIATTHVRHTDTAEVVSISVRLVVREMLSNPMWKWWLRHPELLAERMKIGFRPFAVRDIYEAIDSRRFRLEPAAVEGVYNLEIWMIVAGVIGKLPDRSIAEAEALVVDSILRMMGVSIEESSKLAQCDIPNVPDQEIDFSFSLDDQAEEAGADDSGRGRSGVDADG